MVCCLFIQKILIINVNIIKTTSYQIIFRLNFQYKQKWTSFGLEVIINRKEKKYFEVNYFDKHSN